MKHTEENGGDVGLGGGVLVAPAASRGDKEGAGASAFPFPGKGSPGSVGSGGDGRLKTRPWLFFSSGEGRKKRTEKREGIWGEGNGGGGEMGLGLGERLASGFL